MSAQLVNLQRHIRLNALIGKLVLLALDTTSEFDSLLSRVEQRIEHYEQGKK